MANYNVKTTPNQKVVKVNKQVCNKVNKYALINIDAMEKAAVDLDAGAFKLWVYMAKNQDGYMFALSSKDAAETFGLKIKQYNNAVKDLIEKGYLVNTKGNNYEFNEISVITKGNKDVITKGNKDLSPKVIRNITDNTINNTICGELSANAETTPAGTNPQTPIEKEMEWFKDKVNNLVPTGINRVFKYSDGLFYKPIDN